MLQYVITALIAFLSAFIGGKLLLWSEKRGWKTLIFDSIEDQKDELFDWLKSEDGMTTIASVGKLFGAGVMATVKPTITKAATGSVFGGGNIKIFGMKLPAPLVLGFAQKMGLIPKIGPETASSSERLKSAYR